jgi:membrane protein DedA with SNARE-associated domain
VAIRLITLLSALLGFIAFLYAGVFIASALLPDFSYEAALPYLLGGAILGSVLSGWLVKFLLRRKRTRAK